MPGVYTTSPRAHFGMTYAHTGRQLDAAFLTILASIGFIVRTMPRPSHDGRTEPVSALTQLVLTPAQSK